MNTMVSQKMTIEKRLVAHFSEQAIIQIISSALEAFVVPHDAELNSWTGIETFLTLWGSETQTNEVLSFNVEFAIPSTSAVRDYGSVTPSAFAEEVKQDFITAYFPQFQMIGDLHTHPWVRNRNSGTTPEMIRRKKLYDLSEADIESCLVDPVIKRNTGYKLSAVLTITDMSKSNGAKDGYIESNVIEFSLNNYKCWLKCSAFYYKSEENFNEDERKFVLCHPTSIADGVAMIMTDDLIIRAPVILDFFEYQNFGKVSGKRKLKHIVG